MHIVYVSREYPPCKRGGGIASYVKEIAGTMAKRGHRVTVICASDDTRMGSDSMVDGVRVIRLSGGDFVVPGIEKASIAHKLRMLTRFRSYRNKIRKTILSLDDVDIIEVPEFGAEGYALGNLGIPVTVRLHTPTLLDRNTQGVRQFPITKLPEKYVGRKEIETLKQFKHITSCSQSLKEWFADNTDISMQNVKVIYNPIDLTRWVSAEEVVEDNTILFAGTVAELKGIGELIEACSILRKEGIPVKLKIAGKLGEYGMNLKHTCKNKGRGQCNFLGHINREQLLTEYAQAKVSCFPSWWEALGLVCLEAMAVGNIVVGSESGGMAEILEDGENGLLVVPQNPEVLAQTLEKALQMTPDEMQAMKANARKSLEVNYSTDVIAAQFEKYYEQIIAE